MPHKKLLAAITVIMMLNGGSRLLAAYSLDQLKEIERLVAVRDSAGLGQFLAAHPEVTRGGDPLAVELRKFLRCAQGGGLDCFSVAPIRTDKRGDGARKSSGSY